MDNNISLSKVTFFLVIVTSFIAGCCAASSVIVFLGSFEVRDEYVRQATKSAAEERPVVLPKPTFTPTSPSESSSTSKPVPTLPPPPEPTLTPTPTPESTLPPSPTPTPAVKSIKFEEIKRSKQDTGWTDIQFEEYKKSIKGLRVDSWQGNVVDVKQAIVGEYYVEIDMLSTKDPIDVFIYIPKDIAMGLRKDQPLAFSGVIDNLYGGTLGDYQVEVRDVTILTPAEAPAPAAPQPTPTAVSLGSCKGVKLSGHGDNVIAINPPCGGAVSISHNGKANFVVIPHPYGMLVINEVGNYNGTVLIPEGTNTLEIRADGDWTIVGQ